MSVTFANVAVPIFFPQPLLALIALLPVVAVETLILRRARIRVREILIANVWSGIWGVPLAFVCVAILGSGFNMMLDKNSGDILNVLAVLLALIVPCCVLSIFLEGHYLRTRVNGISGKSFWSAITKAHCYSYLVLLAVYCVWLTIQIW
jgi:hypothetical protein